MNDLPLAEDDLTSLDREIEESDTQAHIGRRTVLNGTSPV